MTLPLVRPLISSSSICGFAILLVLLCRSSIGGENTAHPEIRLAIAGQALIKIDPRKHATNPFESLKPILKSADVGFTNFEMAVDRNCGLPSNYQVVFGKPALEEPRPGNTDGPHAVKENVMEFLASMNFKLQSLANNHAWDLGGCGVDATIAAAKKHGVVHAGTGRTIAEATQAAFYEVKGVKIALIAATTSLDHRETIMPSKSGSGVNGVWTGWGEDWDRNLAAIKAAAKQADFVIYYQHFQIHQEDANGKGESAHQRVGNKDAWQEKFAKATIDAGAGMYIAHGSRIFDGVEIYQGKPIFRQFGGLSYQGLKDEGSYDPLVWEGLLGMLTIKDGEVRTIEITPLSLDMGNEAEYGDARLFREKRGFAEVAKGAKAKKILDRFQNLSNKYGTAVEIKGERAILDLKTTR